MENQRSEAWFQKRIGRLTGSNVGAALGVNPYKSPDDLLRQMVREWHGEESEFRGHAATAWGSFNEAGAQAEYEMEIGNKVEETGFHVHPGLDWLGASPDGLVGEDGVVEIKCPFGQRDTNPPQFKTAEEQAHYYAQMQIEMACTARGWCDFYQWAPHGSRLERVYRDEPWLSWALPLLREFHGRFLAELDNPDHLEPKRVEIETLRAERLIQEREELAEAVEQAQARQKEIMSELVQMTGERNALICGHKLTRVEKQGSVSYARVVKEHCPEVDLDKYRGKASVSWRLS